MKVKDLIKNKDYDYISFRLLISDIVSDDDIFFGCCKSENGKLISLDGDTYSENEEVVKYEEWSTNEIKNGLTVVVEMECG